MPRSKSNAIVVYGQGNAPSQRRGQPRQQKQAKQKDKRGPPAQRPQKSLGFDRLPEYVKCVLNPFDEPACGYPDYFNYPTCKFKAVESIPVVTDAAGTAVLCFSPALARSLYSTTVTAGVCGTATFTPHPDYTEITGISYWHRVVCMGVKIEYVGNMMNAAGTVTVIQDPGIDYVAGLNVATLQDDGDTRAASMGRVVPVLPRQDARYEADTTSIANSPTFPYVYIVCVGLPASSTVLRVTCVKHVELLPMKKTATLRGTTSKTPMNPAAMVALSNITPDAQTSVAGWSDGITALASQAWNGIAEVAVPYAAAKAGAWATEALMLTL